MTNSKGIAATILAVAVITQLAACGLVELARPSPTATWTPVEELYRAAVASPPAQPGISLESTEWVLLRLGTSHLVPGSHITLSFDGGQVSGYGGCNRYRGRYEVVDGALSIPEITRTARACPGLEGVMDQEAAYVRALTSAAYFQVEDEGLLIRGARGVPLGFVPKKQGTIDPGELLGTAWQLVSMDGNRPVEGSSPILSFHDHHRAAGHTGCRDYVAAYRTTGGYFSYYVMDMAGAGCPEGESLAEQEEAYTALLAEARDYRLAQGRLEILTRQDEALVYEPLPASANAALEGTTWTLRAFVVQDILGQRGLRRYRIVDLLPETELTLALEEGTAEGSAGCNAYQAAYWRERGLLSFSSLTFDDAGCEDAIMQQELVYLDLLQDVTAYRIDGSQLWLDAENGRALVFAAGE
ncbi:META domain-containing protein [Chloroflexota bacterium]